MNPQLDDPKGTDRYDLVLDIIEHNEQYSAEKLEEILSDPETREIYNLLCKTDSAIHANKEIDVDTEWERFSQKHPEHTHRHFSWFGNRAASIAVIICTSIAAVAAGIAVTIAFTHRTAEPAPLPEDTEVIASAITVASDSVTAQSDTTMAQLDPIMFEDQPFEKIMETVAEIYGVEVKFNNNDTANLHLYYKLNPALSLDEVISQLNTFEQIDIKRNGNTLIID